MVTALFSSVSRDAGIELKSLFIKACREIKLGKNSGSEEFFWQDRKCFLSWEPVLDFGLLSKFKIAVRIQGTEAFSDEILAEAQIDDRIKQSVEKSIGWVWLRLEGKPSQVSNWAKIPFAKPSVHSLRPVPKPVVRTDDELWVPLRDKFIEASKSWCEGNSKGCFYFDFFGQEARLSWGATKKKPEHTSFFISIDETQLPDSAYRRSAIFNGKYFVTNNYKVSPWTFDIVLTMPDAEIPSMQEKAL